MFEALPIDVAWIAICAMIVFFMQAGFAMLESGLVRSKNAVNVIMKNYIDMSFGAIAFFVVGFGLMFGANRSGFFGTSLFAPAGLSNADYGFLVFQMMFAATAATIVSGALAERIRYWPYVFAAVAISGFIYPVFGSWVWGGLGGGSGWLARLGFVDFAGSAVVHAVGGWCALAGVVALGARSGRFPVRMERAAVIPGHNLPLAALGAFVLWFGFFAFNAGSTLAVTDSLGAIVLNTHLSGAAGVAGAVLYVVLTRRPLLLAFPINGGLGGLVAICAGADVLTPLLALVTGLIAGVVVIAGMDLLESLRIDDAVGAVPVHAFAGSWGVLAVGLFHPSHPLGVALVGIQLVGIVAAAAWTLPVAYLAFRALATFMPLRVSVGDERRGLDYSEHHELGYPEFQKDLLHGGLDDDLRVRGDGARAAGPG